MNFLFICRKHCEWIIRYIYFEFDIVQMKYMLLLYETILNIERKPRENLLWYYINIVGIIPKWWFQSYYCEYMCLEINIQLFKISECYRKRKIVISAFTFNNKWETINHRNWFIFCLIAKNFIIKHFYAMK